jgi:hypothetical protein
MGRFLVGLIKGGAAALFASAAIWGAVVVALYIIGRAHH